MLKQEYLDRKVRRSSYSERAFARDLKVSSGFISLLFRGQRSLSPAKGLQIANRLGWSEERVNQFVDLIQRQGLQSASSAKVKGKAKSPFVELEIDAFRFIADLNHIAALTLIQSRDGQTSKSVAKILGLTPVEAELVISRLNRLGMVEDENGRLKTSKKSVEIKEVPSEAIRSLHRQAILKAEEAIEGQSAAIRNLAALTLSFNPRQMSEAKAFTNRFLKAFEKKFGNADHGEIYQINTQFFKLSKGNK